MHLMSYASAHIKRVVRSTISAETYQVKLTVEANDLVRAAFLDVKGLLNCRDWGASAALQVRSVWYTACRSAYTALTKAPLAKPIDKRLGIELAEEVAVVATRQGHYSGSKASRSDAG